MSESLTECVRTHSTQYAHIVRVEHTMESLRLIFGAISVIDQHAKAIGALADDSQRQHEYECMLRDIAELTNVIESAMQRIALSN